MKVKVLSKPADDKSADPRPAGHEAAHVQPGGRPAPQIPAQGRGQGQGRRGLADGPEARLGGGAAAFCAAADCDPVSGYKAGDPVSAIVLSVNANTFEVLVSVNKFEEIKDRKRMAQYLKAPPPLTLGQLLSPEKND